MTLLATPDAPLVWDAVSMALTGRPQTATTEAARPDLADLDLRSTRDLARLLNDEDATVPATVVEAARSRLEVSDGSVRKASGRSLDGARPGAQVPASPAPERESR